MNVIEAGARLMHIRRLIVDRAWLFPDPQTEALLIAEEKARVELEKAIAEERHANKRTQDRRG